MTEEEKSGIVHEVIETIKGQSQDITELPVSDNIEDFTTLPAVGRDGRLKKFRVTDLKSEFAGGSNIELVQETGQSEDKAMSQKATTAAIAAATTTTDGKNLQEVYEVSKTAATRASQTQSTIEVVQKRGEATDKPMSQKAVSDALKKVEDKTKDIEETISSISASGGVPIVQEIGDSTTKVMSQSAVTEAIANVEKKTEELAKKKEVKKEYASLATSYSQSSAYQNALGTNVYISTWKPLKFDVYLSKFTLSANWLKDVTEITNNVIKLLVADADGKVIGIHEATISVGQYEIDIEKDKVLVPKGGYVALLKSNLGSKSLYSDTSVPAVVNKWAGTSQVGDGMTSRGKDASAWTPAYSVTYYAEKEDNFLRDLKSELFKEVTGNVGKSVTSNVAATLFPNGWKVLDVDVELTKITLGKTVTEDKNAYLLISTNDDEYPIDRIVPISVKKNTSEIDVSGNHIVISKGAICVLVCVGDIFLSNSVREQGIPNVAYTTQKKGDKAKSDVWNRSLAPNYSIEYKYVSTAKQEKIDTELHTITVEDMKGILMCGSSLTYSARQPKSMSWGERLNDMLDINLYNGGISGSTLKANMQLLATNGAFGFTSKGTPSSITPSYILFNNAANGTPSGPRLQDSYKAALSIARMYGAKMIIGGEEPEMQTVSWNGTESQAFDRAVKAFAEENDVLASPLLYLQTKLRATSPYRGFASGVHGNYRLIAPYLAHFDLFNRLPISKSVKMFKYRNTYKDGAAVVSDLVFDNNLDRMKFFTAISCGAGDDDSTTQTDNCDRLNDFDHSSNGGMNVGNSTSESIAMRLEGEIAFNKFALIEFILDRVNVTSVKFSIKSNINPSHVYFGVKEAVTSGDIVKLSWKEAEVSYKDGVISASFEHLHLEDLDKVRVLIETNGDFKLSRPTLSYSGGREKMLETRALANYNYRQFGKELMDKTSVESGWTLVGGAVVEKLPALIANYPKYNSSKAHINLSSASHSMSKKIDIEQGTNKVAIRVVAQVFPKIATKRYNSTAIVGTYAVVAEKISEVDQLVTAVNDGQTVNVEGRMVDKKWFHNQYLHQITQEEATAANAFCSPTSPSINEYDYVYSRMIVTIGNQQFASLMKRESLVTAGWQELYFEVELQPEDTAIQIKIEREAAIAGLANSGLPMFIHDVSLQKIN